LKKTKTIFILLISLQLLLTSFAYAACPVDPHKPTDTFNRLCKNVDDIICKNVPDRIRRSCDEKDKTIVHAGMTSHEVYEFAKGCMVSAATSFVEFFTVFLPELCKEIWKLTKEMYELVSSQQERSSVWSKIKGAYESARSLSSDVYEAVKKNPGQYFSELWNKIERAVAPLVADYDCLNPQTKVEKICGFVASWVVPPALLAKVIVKGAKGAKELVHIRILEKAAAAPKVTSELKVKKAFKRVASPAEELAARLKLDTNNLQKQAFDLRELRLHQAKGMLKDPRKQLMLEALELRAPELSILSKEIDD
jgi:hypothetical protein